MVKPIILFMMHITGASPNKTFSYLAQEPGVVWIYVTKVLCMNQGMNRVNII